MKLRFMMEMKRLEARALKRRVRFIVFFVWGLIAETV